MKNREDARALADSLYRTGKELGRRVTAVITSMDQPLGRTVGNFLEVRESVETLQGRGPEDLRAVTLRLAGPMLRLGGLCDGVAEGERRAAETLADGSAWTRFLRNVELQGGRTDVLLDASRAPTAEQVVVHASPGAGHVGRIDAYRIGLAAVYLGAGRSRQEDPVLPEVGVELLCGLGDPVARDQPLCRIHARAGPGVEQALEQVRGAFRIDDERPKVPDLVVEEIGD